MAKKREKEDKGYTNRQERKKTDGQVGHLRITQGRQMGAEEIRSTKWQPVNQASQISVGGLSFRGIKPSPGHDIFAKTQFWITSVMNRLIS